MRIFLLLEILRIRADRIENKSMLRDNLIQKTFLNQEIWLKISKFVARNYSILIIFLNGVINICYQYFLVIDGVCVFDDAQNRVLDGYHVADMTMTIQKCLHICRKKGYQFSGLQWQIECYCGNMPSNGFEWAWPGKCDDRCAGDPNQMCGGSMAISLYNTPLITLNGLCVYDYPDQRVFEGPSFTGQNDMTIEKCKDLCSKHKFFGVQARVSARLNRVTENSIQQQFRLSQSLQLP